MWWRLSTLFLASMAVVNFPFIPFRPALMVFYFSKDINFLLVTLVCVLGTTIGVIPVYGMIYKMSENKKAKEWLEKGWLQKILNPIKHNMFLIIVLINITPLPDILVGAISGTEKYDFKKFLLANFIGRVIFYFPFALGGVYFAGDLNAFEHWLMKMVHLFI